MVGFDKVLAEKEERSLCLCELPREKAKQTAPEEAAELISSSSSSDEATDDASRAAPSTLKGFRLTKNTVTSQLSHRYAFHVLSTATQLAVNSSLYSK